MFTLSLFYCNLLQAPWKQESKHLRPMKSVEKWERLGVVPRQRAGLWAPQWCWLVWVRCEGPGEVAQQGRGQEAKRDHAPRETEEMDGGKKMRF